jgi:hypothetical protein
LIPQKLQELCKKFDNDEENCQMARTILDENNLCRWESYSQKCRLPENYLNVEPNTILIFLLVLLSALTATPFMVAVSYYCDLLMCIDDNNQINIESIKTHIINRIFLFLEFSVNSIF